ncbi:hypothetical protein U1Q18_039728 [Sarracenia purpurea var. burkii]
MLKENANRNNAMAAPFGGVSGFGGWSCGWFCGGLWGCLAAPVLLSTCNDFTWSFTHLLAASKCPNFLFTGSVLLLVAVGAGWLGAYSWEVAKGLLVGTWMPVKWGLVHAFYNCGAATCSGGLEVAFRYLKLILGCAVLGGCCLKFGSAVLGWLGVKMGDGRLGDCSWEIAKGFASGYMLGRLQSRRLSTFQVAALLTVLIHLAKLQVYMVAVKRVLLVPACLSHYL